MRAKLFIALVCLPLAVLAAPAEKSPEKLPVLKVGNDIYTNVVVTAVTATDIYFTSAQGMGNVKLKRLPPELQQHFGYDATNAIAIEKSQIVGNAQYRQKIAAQPAPPAASPAQGGDIVDAKGNKIINVPLAHAAELSWGTDLKMAKRQAFAEEKLILMDFTGSDWCSWCQKFDRDVLSTDQFASYAKARLVLMRLDFPRNTPLPDDLMRSNSDLAKQFKIGGFPTFVVLDSYGHEVARVTGYQEGGPNAFITLLDKLKP